MQPFRRTGPFVAGLFAMMAAGLALVTALVSQYGFELYPCALCHYQRWAQIAAGGLGLVTLLLARTALAYWTARFAALAFLAGAGIALFHVGVEAAWWQGTSGCATPDFGSGMSREDIKSAILSAPTVACDAVAFRFLGLSMAGWNLVYSSIAAMAVGWLASGKGRTP
ncbi:MAG: disulfide bond formation protein B [Rhodospirillales bacterium]|nr:disulfide bond formation protein B [Rhodospirillales bacterium]